jgi:hypothetical protein
VKLTKIIFLTTIAGLLNTAIMANPDVFFADSANYQDAYLTHEFDADNIKFTMSNYAVNIALPAQSYNFDALVSFTSDAYQFENPALKADVVNPKIKPNKFENGGLFSNLQH